MVVQYLSYCNCTFHTVIVFVILSLYLSSCHCTCHTFSVLDIFTFLPNLVYPLLPTSVLYVYECQSIPVQVFLISIQIRIVIDTCTVSTTQVGCSVSLRPTLDLVIHSATLLHLFMSSSHFYCCPCLARLLSSFLISMVLSFHVAEAFHRLLLLIIPFISSIFIFPKTSVLDYFCLCEMQAFILYTHIPGFNSTFKLLVHCSCFCAVWYY